MSSEERTRADGYWRYLLEIILIVVALTVAGGLLSLEHVALGMTDLYAETVRLILLALGTALVLGLIHRPLRRRMEARGGAHFASVFSFFGTLVVGVVAFLALLAVLSIPPSSFLVAVGGIGIVVGFAVSTITTNVISGAFMLTSFPIKIGQRVIITVNNQPGTITAVSTLFMTVTTDAGAKLIIPNSAIFQGAAFLLDVGGDSGESRTEAGRELLARPGDRVLSSVYPYPATVVEVTSVITRIMTDGGGVLDIPNQAILNGGSALIRIQKPDEAFAKLPIAVGDEVRLSSGDFRGKVTQVGPYYFRVSGAEEDVVLPIVSLTTGGVMVFKKKAQPSS
jgi:small-conductance mechanosensitive channel